jgi:hypothetical protein
LLFFAVENLPATSSQAFVEKGLKKELFWTFFDHLGITICWLSCLKKKFSSSSSQKKIVEKIANNWNCYFLKSFCHLFNFFSFQNLVRQSNKRIHFVSKFEKILSQINQLKFKGISQ